MAEPVFDEHPLEEYFRSSWRSGFNIPRFPCSDYGGTETGETSQILPGGAPEFIAEPDDSECASAVGWLDPEHLPYIVVEAIQSPESTFAERFKYDVISSSLLSTSIAAPLSATRRSFSPELPGRLDQESNASQSSSLEQNEPTVIPSSLTEFNWLIVSVSIAAVALFYEFYFVAIFLIGGATYSWHAEKVLSEKASIMSATLRVLNDVISSGNVWDSAVNEAMAVIEKEERSQCDNVRQLLSALTEPSQLSQLSEMYAPSSPMRETFPSLNQPRPLSVPLSRQRTMSGPADKRATWNGSYASLALAGSPTSHLQKRRSYRNSDMLSLFDAQSAKVSSLSAPPSPLVPISLQGVQEEDDDESPSASPAAHSEYFGAALLDFQRKRRSAGMETIGIPPPPSYSSHSPRSHRSSGSTSFSPVLRTIPSSRFTTVHTTRHPLSLSGLQLALHGALSAKRYACSHLLALRFEEDEDDSYWEDVRSVMALLTSTFEDASSRLMEALNEAERKRVQDERPSPERDVAAPVLSPAPRSRTMAEMISFAPMPSHLSRFAAHVDAISTALNEARLHLEQTVASLRDPSPAEGVTSAGGSATVAQEHPAFQAYDRLRKELGFALRECERGREQLLDIVSGPRIPSTNEDADDSPGLGQDSESEPSERPGPSSPAIRLPNLANESVTLALSPGDEQLDDATAHLLLTASSQHLPPPGIEQVYEADTGVVAPFTRERSKLTREERIKLAKSRRESAVSDLMDPSEQSRRSSVERWGPGGEVVQELKDVIWKVSEKRRKLVGQSESQSCPEQEQPSLVVHDTPRTAELQSPEVVAS
ncbi:predicted protein [Postia placenta Mad-698-R]|nr:predicted protein [Postia placenta Mad-698-R]